MSDTNVGVLHGCAKACEASRQHKETCLGPLLLCGDCVALAGLNIKVHPGSWPKTDSGECGDDGNPY